MSMPRRLVVKFKLPRELHFDLTKSLKPRWATKARTPRLPVVIGVSSSVNQKNTQVLIGSEASVLQPDSEKVTNIDDDDSGNLKRKFEQTHKDINGSGRGDQKTDSGVVSEGEIRESEIKIDEKAIMIGFADDHDDSGSLKRCKLEETGRGDHDKNIQETDSWVFSVSPNAEIKESEIKIDDIKNLQASVNENDAPKTPIRYACSMCSKTFSSHQALGGHKSSHYKFTMKIYDAINDDLRPNNKKLFISTTTTTTCHQQIGTDDRTTHYTCKICFKKFPSGQALGGHQRRHWNGNIMKTQSAPKMLDFDLNELPKDEDEDDLCANYC